MMFYNYEEILGWYAKARDPAKGRPVSNWGRIIKHGTEFHFYVKHSWHPDLGAFFKVTPDNLMTFFYTGQQVRTVSNTIVASINRYFPIAVGRKRMACYYVLHQRYVSNFWKDPAAEGTEIYPGLQMNMRTGEVLNPKAPVVEVVDEARRKEWLKMLRKFKRSMYVRAKLGVFEALARDGHESTGLPDWTSVDYQKLLLDAMVNDNYTQELMHAVVATVYGSIWRHTEATSQQYVDHIDKICAIASRDLRRQLGVLKEGGE